MEYRVMGTKHKVRLHSGYVLRVADLMAPVEIAEDFTLGDLCRIINHFEDIDIETFSTLLHCPLEPLLEECLRPRDTSSLPKSDLHYIRLFWECEYDACTQDRSPSASSLALSVDGIGDIWEEYQPGGRFYEEGRDAAHCNRYGIELAPLYTLRDLPLRIDPIMTVRPSPTQKASHPSLDIPAPGVTVLQLIHALFWELSFFGTPEQRDAAGEELGQQVKRIKAGEERLIPYEDIS
jgi:hypothetical protein